MRRVPARRGAFVVVACLVAVLAACSGGSSSTGPPTMHPGTAPATAHSTEAASQLTSDAAIAAVKRMYAEFNLALRTLNSTSYRRSFTPKCGFCVSNAELIDGLRQRREHIDGGAFSLRNVRVAYAQPQFILVEGFLTQEAARITRAGKTIRSYAAASQFRAIWRVELGSDAPVITKEDVPK